MSERAFDFEFLQLLLLLLWVGKFLRFCVYVLYMFIPHWPTRTFFVRKNAELSVNK
jgi:hypothetical protein